MVQPSIAAASGSYDIGGWRTVTAINSTLTAPTLFVPSFQRTGGGDSVAWLQKQADHCPQQSTRERRAVVSPNSAPSLFIS